ncbi:MAG: helix-hairpin-helix domain-containing protein [Flavobacteriales bacterium]|nr:helix-hairpin-helix domain-containing protein [Flavobacteriales bacterium]
MARRYRPRNWKEELKDLFAMHKGERSAFTVLMGLCLIGAAWVTWEQWIRPPRLADQESIKVIWQSMQESNARHEPPGKANEEDLQLFRFDPNGLPLEQWVLLGLSERQAASIHRYEARGGKFRTKGDLARMRVVSPELFAQWQAYIALPEVIERPHPGRPEKKDRWPEDTTGRWPKHDRAVHGSVPLELNGADSAALVAVRGIGPSFARSILRYRERLGGYANMEQLGEVPILRDKPEAVEQIKTKLTVDPGKVRVFALNTCTVEDLGRHPYMGWKVARALIAYRDQHGPFSKVEDIGGCVLVTDSIRLRMAPYLTVGE